MTDEKRIEAKGLQMKKQLSPKVLVLGLLYCLINVSVSSAQAPVCTHVIGDDALEARVKALAQEGQLVVVLRHTDAPTASQPIERTDCENRFRGLSRPGGSSHPDGETQAENVGKLLRWLGIKEAKVEASRACRTIQTAEKLSLGVVDKAADLFEVDCTNVIEHGPRIRSKIDEVAKSSGNSVLVTHSGCVASILRSASDLSAPEHHGIVLFIAKDKSSEVVGCVWPADWTSVESRAKEVGLPPNTVGRADD